MIRIERVSLPDGLRATAHRDPNGDLIIYVSSALDAKIQRAAVMEAVRASRRAGWRAGLPIGVALLLALRLLRRAATAIRARPTAWAAAAATVAGGAAVAGIVLATVPHSHGSSASARPPAGSTGLPRQPGKQQRVPGRRAGQVQPVAAVPPGGSAGQPQPGKTSPGTVRPAPVSGQTSSPPGPAPSPSQSTGPAPSPSAPSQSPPPPPSQSPPPPPAPGSPGSCVILLGVRVCLPLVSLSVTS